MFNTFNLKCLILVLFLKIVCSKDLPPFLKVCSKADPNINDCIIQSLEALKPHLKTGEPDYNIPSVEPIFIKELMREDSGGLKISTTDVEAYGGSDFVTQSIILDWDKMAIELNMLIPKLAIEAQYELDGKILVLPLKGSGKFYANMTDCQTKTLIKFVTYTEDSGEEHIKIGSQKLTINVGGGEVKLDNLFGSESKISEVINETINKSLAVFLKELMPIIEKALAARFTEIGNSIIMPYTYAQLFP